MDAIVADKLAADAAANRVANAVANNKEFRALIERLRHDPNLTVETADVAVDDMTRTLLGDPTIVDAMLSALHDPPMKSRKYHK